MYFGKWTLSHAGINFIEPESEILLACSMMALILLPGMSSLLSKNGVSLRRIIAGCTRQPSEIGSVRLL